jgi:hypothetical protein
MDASEQEIEAALAGVARTRDREGDLREPVHEPLERDSGALQSRAARFGAFPQTAKPQLAAVKAVPPEDDSPDSTEKPRNATSGCEGPCPLETGLGRILQRVLIPEIMSIEAASLVLHFSADTLRRIPDAELPVYRVGKNNLYLREDILRYVRSRRVGKAPADCAPDGGENRVAAPIQEVLGSASVDAREPSIRRVK